MPSNGEKVVIRSVTLYPSDWAIIEAADKSDAGVSATLRRIIREWDGLQMVTIETLPLPPEAQRILLEE